MTLVPSVPLAPLELTLLFLVPQAQQVAKETQGKLAQPVRKVYKV